MRRTRAVIIGGLVFGALALGGAMLSASGREHHRADAVEGRALLRALCMGVEEHHRAYGQWLTAGPLPATLPTADPVEFPRDPTFASLGFAPGKVRLQFQVLARDGSAVCVARGPGVRYELAAGSDAGVAEFAEK